MSGSHRKKRRGVLGRQKLQDSPAFPNRSGCALRILLSTWFVLSHLIFISARGKHCYGPLSWLLRPP